MRVALIILGVVLAVGGVALRLRQPPPPTSSEITVLVGNSAFKVSMADEQSERSRGLRDRQQLAAGHGMLFRFPQSAIQVFTMDGMRFGLDLVWIVDGRVAGITPEVAPAAAQAYTRYPSPVAVDTVLELPARTSQQLSLSVGAPVSIYD